MADSKVLSIKLLIDSKTNRVVFGEAGKDFVDFLLNLLSLPVASLIKLVTTEEMAGSVGNIYQSLETIRDMNCYTLSERHIHKLAEPTVPALTPITNRLLGNKLLRSPDVFYKCYHCHNYIGTQLNMKCPCGISMSRIIKLLEPIETTSVEVSFGDGGFVKDVVRYMIMDDLTIQPITSLTMVNKFEVKDVRSLQEKVVDIGPEEGVKLLKASLNSKTVLSDVFLPK